MTPEVLRQQKGEMWLCHGDRMKAILLGTQPKGSRNVRLAKQMGSKLPLKCENFKPHSDKVTRPREVISV